MVLYRVYIRYQCRMRLVNEPLFSRFRQWDSLQGLRNRICEVLKEMMEDGRQEIYLHEKILLIGSDNWPDDGHIQRHRATSCWRYPANERSDAWQLRFLHD